MLSFKAFFDFSPRPSSANSYCVGSNKPQSPRPVGANLGRQQARRLLQTSHILIAVCALSACAGGPNDSKIDANPAAASSPVNPACPDLKRWGARQLYGTWSVELPGLDAGGTLLLRQHPEFSASLRGEFDVAGQHSIASGDLEDGELNLDESRDGKSLFAFWTGQLVPAACGREIRGTWQQLPRAGEPARESTFVLRREGGNGSRW